MYRVLSDGTLMGYTKLQLIKQLRIAEHNWMAANANLEQQYENVKDWEPVVHGRWMQREKRGEVYCSNCNSNVGIGNFDEVVEEEYYCPSCGAKMDLEDEHEMR